MASNNHLNLNNLKDRERAIWRIKNYFEEQLQDELNLIRVSAPLILPAGKGINDDLNGIERKATFPVKQMNDQIHELNAYHEPSLSVSAYETGQRRRYISASFFN
mmetsp:Transcript_4631/g.7696  ORF Transcript_4631/g.7696 Transcript_4631/m.7696 type:complete len:105 (+) Transcript_4631:304-618(+)